MQQRPSSHLANSRAPLHAAPHQMWRPQGGTSALCTPSSVNCVDGNTASLLPELILEQLSGESMAADEGDTVVQAVAGTIEKGTFVVGEGYFSNLLNEENPNMFFDDFSRPPDESSSPAVASTPSLRPNQKRIEDRKQSEVTFQDKLVQALALFKREDNDNKSFQFMHCWNQLRNQPKWQEKRRRIDAIKQTPNKKSKVNKNSSPETATTIILDSSKDDILENASPCPQETNW
ncbi:hypothetical protein BS78_01G239400 [Paspalum vaginatum]|nr:hypothetical protein BS78_01G239400 [Paspalum vaginatum]